ncbi:MAG: thermosome subunit [Aigarchaeota archaeon]|nr:thermosome subunit [Aigarchaeota archaeon]MDW8021188.1 thermosome subunit alpha [Nitrososphaerota archaeon]
MSDRPFIIRDPLLLHREGVLRSRGEKVREANVAVVRTMADFLRPAYGPMGTSKLLIDRFGELAVTRDGAKILDMMDVYHPVAKFLKEAAKTVEATVGDGVKTTILLIEDLLRRAEGLMKFRIQVNSIIKGYRTSYEVALRRLSELARPFDYRDRSLLEKIVKGMLISRGLEFEADHLAKLVADAVQLVVEERDNKIILDKKLVQIVKKTGKSLLESGLVRGIILDRRVAHKAMPRRVENAKVAVLDLALKIDPFKHLQPIKEEVVIRDAGLIRGFLDEERRIVEEMVNRIIAVGANAVFCRKRVGSIAGYMLAKKGIIAVGRLLKDEHIDAVVHATGARRIADIDDLKPEDLGRAELIEERNVGGDRVIAIEGGKSARMASILLRGNAPQLLEEVERVINDVLTCLASLAEKPSYVPGGGASEVAMSIAIRNESLKYPGREQVAMHAFANSLENLSGILAKNSGMSPVDVLTELRSKHVQGEHEYGIDAFSRKVTNVYEAGIIEPLVVKEQILKTCIEVASSILMIDDVVDRRYAKRHRGELP